MGGATDIFTWHQESSYYSVVWFMHVFIIKKNPVMPNKSQNLKLFKMKA